ncbi:MAG: hypothetical protein ACOY0T_14595 [Myxococcota bacterium]
MAPPREQKYLKTNQRGVLKVDVAPHGHTEGRWERFKAALATPITWLGRRWRGSGINFDTEAEDYLREASSYAKEKLREPAKRNADIDAEITKKLAEAYSASVDARNRQRAFSSQELLRKIDALDRAADAEKKRAEAEKLRAEAREIEQRRILELHRRLESKGYILGAVVAEDGQPKVFISRTKKRRLRSVETVDEEE